MLSVWEHLFPLLQLVTTSFSLGNWRIMVHRIRNSSALLQTIRMLAQILSPGCLSALCGIAPLPVRHLLEQYYLSQEPANYCFPQVIVRSTIRVNVATASTLTLSKTLNTWHLQLP